MSSVNYTNSTNFYPLKKKKITISKTDAERKREPQCVWGINTVTWRTLITTGGSLIVRYWESSATVGHTKVLWCAGNRILSAVLWNGNWVPQKVAFGRTYNTARRRFTWNSIFGFRSFEFTHYNDIAFLIRDLFWRVGIRPRRRHVFLQISLSSVKRVWLLLCRMEKERIPCGQSDELFHASKKSVPILLKIKSDVVKSTWEALHTFILLIREFFKTNKIFTLKMVFDVRDSNIRLATVSPNHEYRNLPVFSQFSKEISGPLRGQHKSFYLLTWEGMQFGEKLVTFLQRLVNFYQTTRGHTLISITPPRSLSVIRFDCLTKEGLWKMRCDVTSYSLVNVYKLL